MNPSVRSRLDSIDFSKRVNPHKNMTDTDGCLIVKSPNGLQVSETRDVHNGNICFGFLC